LGQVPILSSNYLVLFPDNENYLLYFDNWFSSPILFVEFQKRGLGAIGTIRLNRFSRCTLTADKDMKKKGRGSYEEKETTIENVIIRAIKWHDNKAVTIATTFSSAESVVRTRNFGQHFFDISKKMM
jgi:hypothetical protein